MSKKPNGKGKRYTDKEKSQVLEFVDKVNAEKGRGGITAAAAKFNVTPLTISNWMKKTDATPPSVRSGAHFSSNLRRLADIHEEIMQAETVLTKLKREYAALKKKL
ncbi:MAG: hypothetical protein O3A92_14390 [Verrucomicrobia bacterium]|nr:hypothetical protein [Verrucomicrobiota bacterium]